MSFDEIPTIVEIQRNIRELKSLLNSSTKYLIQEDTREKVGSEVEEIELKMDELVKKSNRYNELFSEYGWIVHETLDVETIIEAVDIFESNDLDSAEKFIKNYYKGKFHKIKKIIFNSRHFQSRKRLFELGYEDYLAERYYSSIPMMLMLVDGVLNDLRLKGFAASNADYEIWDSVSGHSSGLNVIANIYNTSVKKTNEESLELPYRNGILHGRELEYDNETLAIKTNALVIYIFDWIRSYESEGSRKEQFEERNNTQFTFNDLLNHQKQMSEFDQLELEWKKEKVPETTYNKSQLYELMEGTPEQKFMNFITNLNEKKYGLNVRYIPFSARKGHTQGHMAGQIKESFGDFLPITVEELYVNNRGSATSTIKAKLNYNSSFSQEENFKKEITFLFVYQNEKGNPENRLTNKGQWVIMQILEKEFEMR